MVKKNFEGGLLGEIGEVDGGRGGGEFELAGDGGATDSFERAAENELESIALDLGASEIVAEVVENGDGDIRGQWPVMVACTGGCFFEREDQPGLAETCGGSPWDADQGEEPRMRRLSGHRDF